MLFNNETKMKKENEWTKEEKTIRACSNAVQSVVDCLSLDLSGTQWHDEVQIRFLHLTCTNVFFMLSDLMCLILLLTLLMAIELFSAYRLFIGLVTFYCFYCCRKFCYEDGNAQCGEISKLLEIEACWTCAVYDRKSLLWIHYIEYNLNLIVV